MLLVKRGQLTDSEEDILKEFKIDVNEGNRFAPRYCGQRKSIVPVLCTNKIEFVQRRGGECR
jgi:hypothetical protein